MIVDKYGRVEITEHEAFTALYSGKLTDLSNVYIDDSSIIDRYNQSRKMNADTIPELHKLVSDDNISVEMFDQSNQLAWFMPDDHFPDLMAHLYDLCKTDAERDRVDEELKLFIQYNMLDLLFYLKYLVDTLKENQIVCGVGRGSSVASYCLYLLGVHKIDSLKYNLDINEFLK